MESPGQTFVKKSAFAERHGWSPSYVTKLLRQGRIVLSADGKLVDVEASERKLAETATVAGVGVAEYHAANRAAAGRSDVPDPPAAFAGSKEDTYQSFNRARAEREQELATMARMDRQQREGQLVEVDAVRRAAERIGGMIRRAHEQLPARVAALMVATGDPMKAEDLLAQELRRIDAEVSREAATAFPEPRPGEALS